MQEWLAAQAAAQPDHAALIYGDRRYTYRELDAEVGAFASGLTRVPAFHGAQHVAVLLPNSPKYVVAVHALARLGRTLVPLNTRLQPAEIRAQLALADVSLVIHASEFAPLDGTAVWLPVESISSGELLPAASTSLDLTAAQAIVFTSGTTGTPKGAQITFGNHFTSAMASAYRLGHDPNDRWLSVLPLYHVGGLAVIFRSALYGITPVLHDRFDIEHIQHSFDHHHITLISLVPTMLYRMLEAGVRWPASLRLILLGGAAVSPELLLRAFDLGLPVAPTYGLTEAASQVATMRPEDARRKPGSVGKPLLFTSVQIVDENGTAMPHGELGEVVVAGPTLMKGYYGNEAATAKTLRDGVLYTGDVGYMDADGDLWLVQRRSDLIVTGGENVYPVEVEGVLLAHPAVREAVAVGVPHPEWGQQVAAAVVVMLGKTLTEGDLIAYSRQHLAGYKQPRRVLFVDALPQTASGKVQRSAVAAMLNSP